MSFIAKNPLTMPETENTPSVPNGTRGFIAKPDGWYEVDSNNKMRKLATIDDIKESDTQALLDEIDALKEMVNALYAKSVVKTTQINLLGSKWIDAGDNQYSQVVDIEGVTQYSKVDLQPTSEQLAIFYEKDVAFVAENVGGTITIYCIGQKPIGDYIIQATITEIEKEQEGGEIDE